MSSFQLPKAGMSWKKSIGKKSRQIRELFKKLGRRSYIEAAAMTDACDRWRYIVFRKLVSTQAEDCSLTT